MVAGNAGKGWTMLLLGLAFVAAGVFEVMKGDPVVVCAVFFAIAAMALPSGASDTILRRPRLLATEDGVRFSGGVTIPWRSVSAVYAGEMTMRRVWRPSANAESVAFDFHSKRTMLRVPPWLWLATIVSVGDIDITGAGNPKVLAARLEAMRTRVLGTIDGVTPGAGELPKARLL